VVYWREYFAPWILERGYDYYLDGHVTEMKEHENGYIGTVSGSVDYTVNVQNIDDLFADDDDDFYIHCTCPYADTGENCKHMAALLYAIETSDNRAKRISKYSNGEIINKNENSANVLKETLSALSPDIIRSELQKVLESDENLRASFLIKYNRDKNDIAKYMNIMRNKAWMIRRECSDHHGFVDWRNASTYTSRLISEIIENLHDFTSDENEVVQAAFDLSLYVLDLSYEIIMKMAEFAGGRSHYREIVAALRRMLAFPGGKERVQEMLEHWRTWYYNRPAMLDELRALSIK